MTLASSKRDFRRTLFDARIAMSPAERDRANHSLQARIISLLQERGAARVAAYMPTASEPGGQDLVEVLRSSGYQVIIPISNADFSLTWFEVTADTTFQPGPFGIPEPVGDPLPTDALEQVDIILVPTLAVSTKGYRMGKGGGYYDRALAAHPEIPTAAVVFAHELRHDLPLEPHDRATDVIITPEDTIFV